MRIVHICTFPRVIIFLVDINVWEIEQQLQSLLTARCRAQQPKGSFWLTSIFDVLRRSSTTEFFFSLTSHINPVQPYSSFELTSAPFCKAAFTPSKSPPLHSSIGKTKHSHLHQSQFPKWHLIFKVSPTSLIQLVMSLRYDLLCWA